MDLWYAPTSPFARKVRVAAHELGLNDQLRLVAVDPWSDLRLRALNPLAKVPTLVLPGGEVVWESGLIIERLADLAGARSIIPASGPDRWRALALRALADGACTAAGRLFADERRDPSDRSEPMMQRFTTALAATLDRLERADLSDDPTVGEIAVGALLGYLDFRWPDRDWRTPHPRLAGWFETFDTRASMQTTRHS